MPINKITATKRAKAAIAAIMLFVATIGGVVINTKTGNPAAVDLAVEQLIKPWEGVKLTSYKDIVGVWTVCYGETEGIKAGMTFTLDQCKAMLGKRVTADYYGPLAAKIKGFTAYPIALQAAMISGAYNFGVGGMLGSSAARLAKEGRYREACEAQTAWNKAGGRVIKGLVLRREMGDASRIGEAELCVSGL